MEKHYKLDFILLIVLSAMCFGLGMIVSNQHPEWLPNVRLIAVSNECGSYDKQTGVFFFDHPATATEAVRITLPDVQEIVSPTPQRKPKVK